MKNPMALTHNENHAKTKMTHFRRLWVSKEPGHSETFSDKK